MKEWPSVVLLCAVVLTGGSSAWAEDGAPVSVKTLGARVRN
jgi:hypothetical protein